MTATAASANTAADTDVLRVDVPLDRASFRNGELKISSLITNNTYIDVADFNLRAIELEASSTRDGEVRLKVGRYVTPPVPLPGPNNEGLLRIEAPHKSNKSWRLLIEDRINITSLTAVLEPRDDDDDYYESRYERRGYTLGRDDNYRPYSRARDDSWPYSWLNNNYNYNRRSAHWFWLNNPRSSFYFNPGYGHNHRHSRDCYDRFGRHLSFTSSFGRDPFYRGRHRLDRRSTDSIRYRNERRPRERVQITGPREEQRRDRNRPENPVAREQRPNQDQRSSRRDAQRNQAAQAQLQQRLQQAQRAQALQRQQQAARQEQRRRDVREQRDSQQRSNRSAIGPRVTYSQRSQHRSQQRQRSTLQRGSERRKIQRQ